jgi:hypothetical protein
MTTGPSNQTMSGSHINYMENYFQHPLLTKISGKPTYKSLAKLERECKAKGKSVSSTLGGGLLGHLGLVCNTHTYNHISPGVPFVLPFLLVLPNLTNATAHQIAEARQLYANKLPFSKHVTSLREPSSSRSTLPLMKTA